MLLKSMLLEESSNLAISIPATDTTKEVVH